MFLSPSHVKCSAGSSPLQVISSADRTQATITATHSVTACVGFGAELNQKETQASKGCISEAAMDDIRNTSNVTDHVKCVHTTLPWSVHLTLCYRVDIGIHKTFILKGIVQVV